MNVDEFLLALCMQFATHILNGDKKITVGSGFPNLRIFASQPGLANSFPNVDEKKYVVEERAIGWFEFFLIVSCMLVTVVVFAFKT